MFSRLLLLPAPVGVAPLHEEGRAEFCLRNLHQLLFVGGKGRIEGVIIGGKGMRGRRDVVYGGSSGCRHWIDDSIIGYAWEQGPKAYQILREERRTERNEFIDYSMYCGEL
jgi:hypothetical protein